VITLYKSALALIYPSFYEGFGLPLVEAMRCGCPVIASNRSSIPEILNGAGIIVDPGDPAEMSSAMVKCLDEKTKAALQTRGLVRSEEFSWEKSAFQLFQILKSVSA
jgi:glycosyltransferase involved in cell wall biosynthesis